MGNSCHEKCWCHQQTEDRLNSWPNYTGSAGFVTILKVFDAPTQVPNIFDLTVCIKFSILAPFLVLKCLNENYSSVQLGKYWSDMFPSRNGLRQDRVFFIVCHFEGSYKPELLDINWYTPAFGLFWWCWMHVPGV